MGEKDPVLIQTLDLSQLDCLGKKISVTDFCLKQKDLQQNLIRAYADAKKETVVCETADRVILSYQCEQGDLYCAKSEEGCSRLGPVLAKKLSLYHHSLIEREEKKQLSCYFFAENLLEPFIKSI